MFTVTISSTSKARPPYQQADWTPLGSGTASKVKVALNEAARTTAIPPHAELYRVDLTENGGLIITTFGDTATEAITEARAMLKHGQ